MSDSLIFVTTNSELYINRSVFTDNYSFGRGSILYGENNIMSQSSDQNSANIFNDFFSEYS